MPARGWPALLPALLALGSKEVAITLPAMATLVVWLVLPAEERRPRRRVLGVLTVAHIASLLVVAVGIGFLSRGKRRPAAVVSTTANRQKRAAEMKG
jgi:O-antigen ligase